MRGMFTCGVIDVFMENGIDFEAACGISAGAVFGCNFKSRQSGRPIRYNKKFSRDPRYCSIRSWIRTGDLYGEDFCYRQLPDELDPFDKETFRKNPMKFYVGATDLKTGKAVFYRCTDGGEKDLKWMRASASMPLVSRIVKVDGYELLDGGIADSVPYRYMEKLGYTKNVIILTQPKGYKKKKSAAMPLIRIALRKYPAVVATQSKRHEIYNCQMTEINRREADGSAFVIRPPKALGIGRTEHDPEKLEQAYQTGRTEALRRLPELKKFLSA